MSHTVKTIPVSKEWAQFIKENAVKRGHPGPELMSIAEIMANTGVDRMKARKLVIGMKSCVSIHKGKNTAFYRPQ